MNCFLIRLWCVMKSGFYTTTRDDHLSGWTKRKLQSTSQSQTCTKKGHGHWWSAVGLIHDSFLNPGEPIASENYAQQIDDVHRKLQCFHPALINRQGPVFLHDNAWPHGTQPTVQKLNELGYKVSPHLLCSPACRQLTTTSSSILTTFCRVNAPIISRMQKMVSRSSPNPEAWVFYALGINKLISHWQKCVDCSSSYFD